MLYQGLSLLKQITEENGQLHHRWRLEEPGDKQAECRGNLPFAPCTQQCYNGPPRQDKKASPPLLAAVGDSP
jgi:hypothetical protein